MRKKAKETKAGAILSAFQNVMGDAPHIEMAGNREIRIEGAQGVLEYDSCVIRINTGGMIISMKGRNLNLKCLSPSSLIIEGFITEVGFIT